MRLYVADIICRLPPEDQKWLRRMDDEDRDCVEIVLNYVGAESFVQNWQHHRDDFKDANAMLPPILGTRKQVNWARNKAVAKFGDIRSKVAAEGQAWLQKLERFDYHDEFDLARNRLNEVGEEAFVRDWEKHRTFLDVM